MTIFSTIGSLIAGDQQSDAIEDASDAQAQAMRDALQFQRESRDQNLQLQTPWMNTGLTANAHINALLGLNVPQSPVAPAPTSGGGGSGPFGGNGPPFPPLSGLNMQLGLWRRRLESGDVTLEQVPEQFRQYLGGSNGTVTPPLTTPTITQPTAEAAYDAFKNYTDYKDRLEEGNNAFNSAWAANGTLQSGAAAQELMRQNQNFASREFGNYMGYLGGQQQVGVGATNALSGVTTNYGNNAANLAMQNGNNLANAAIAQGNVSANTIGNVAGGIGQMAGMFLGSSFSDRRLKTKIKLLRRDPDGLGWYEFAYHTAPDEMVVGVMADEVKALRPKAYDEDERGYGMVNYAELGSTFSRPLEVA